MWDLPGPGLEPVSPVLAGRFLTTVPWGKPPVLFLFSLHLSVLKRLVSCMEGQYPMLDYFSCSSHDTGDIEIHISSVIFLMWWKNFPINLRWSVVLPNYQITLSILLPKLFLKILCVFLAFLVVITPAIYSLSKYTFYIRHWRYKIDKKYSGFLRSSQMRQVM